MIAVALTPGLIALVFLFARLIKKGWPEKPLYVAMYLITLGVVILEFTCLP